MSEHDRIVKLENMLNTVISKIMKIQDEKDELIERCDESSAKVHLFPLYLMRHVRDRGPKYKTRLAVYLVHSA